MLKVRAVNDNEGLAPYGYVRPSIIEEQRWKLGARNGWDRLPQAMPCIEMLDPHSNCVTQVDEDNDFLLLH